MLHESTSNITTTDQTVNIPTQYTAFLDIINPVLCDLLKKKFNFNRLSIEELIDSNNIDYLFFYNSSQLEATGNFEAIKVSKMIRRGFTPDAPFDTDDPIGQYVNFYKLYLDKYVTAEELEKYISSKKESSVVTDMLILSKYVYAKTYDRRGKTLAKKTLKRVSSYNLSLTCMYVYLYKCIERVNPNNGLEEYRAFYKRTVSSDNGNNIYLRLLLKSKNEGEYQEIKQTILSTKRIYHPNLIAFFTEYIKHVKHDCLSLKQDIDEIATHLATADFLQRDIVGIHLQKTNNILSKRVENAKKKIYSEFKNIGLEDLALYRDSGYLDRSTLQLLETAVGNEDFQHVLDSIFNALNISETLVTQLILRYLDDIDQDKVIILKIVKSVLPNISIKHFRELIEAKIVLKSRDHDVLLSVLSQTGDYSEILKAVHSGYIDLSRLDQILLVKILNACTNADTKTELLFKSVRDANRAIVNC